MARFNAAARILDELGVLDKIELVQLPEVYRLKTPDLDISVPQRDPEAYIALLAEHFPAEKDGSEVSSNTWSISPTRPTGRKVEGRV